VAARAVEVLAAVNRPLAARRIVWCNSLAHGRRRSIAQRQAHRILAQRRIHHGRLRAKGGFFPGQAAVLDLGGERNGDLVVKSPVALPLHLNPAGGFGSGFPDSKMGVLGYVHQVWLDVDWSTKAEATYEKILVAPPARVTTA